MSLSDQVRIAAELRERLALEAGDEETLHDMIEGETSLLETLVKIARSAREAEAFGKALKAMENDMSSRRTRYDNRAIRLRRLILWAMQEAGITKHEAPDLTFSVGKPCQTITITDEAILPMDLLRITTSPDKEAIKARLEAGETVPGATFSNSVPSLTIKGK